MPYTDRFRLADEYIVYLNTVMGGIADPFIQSRFLGFVTTSAVTVYELAIKDIFYDFSDKKHAVLGEFARARFERLNGRIKLDFLKGEHIAAFGAKYVAKFGKQLEEKERQILADGGGSIKSSYGNIISWRHSFVHGGTAPATTNYAEVKSAYELGKEVIHCLDRAMKR